MLTRCVRGALRPGLWRFYPVVRAGEAAQWKPGTVRLTPGRFMGTHGGKKDPKEPLNSPQRVKEFIYRLQPAERTCLLQELQTFENTAIAQGESAIKSQIYIDEKKRSNRCV